MSENKDEDELIVKDTLFEMLPDHLLIEIFIRVPISEWTNLAPVKRRWAYLFRGDCLWQAALNRAYPLASKTKRWPGPIPRGTSKRRYAALDASKNILGVNTDIDEIMGHMYLFLNEQLMGMPPPSGVLHGTMVDQLIACGKSKEVADELVTQIWLAILDNLEDTKHTFFVLKCIAQEGDVFLPYPYSRPVKVQWRVFEKLFTDFRDCFSHSEYTDVLGIAKNKFQPIPSLWLGY